MIFLENSYDTVKINFAYYCSVFAGYSSFKEIIKLTMDKYPHS